MARTVVSAGTVYRSDRSTSVYYMTGGVASSTLVPTQVELDAATTHDITGAIAGVSGFMTSRSSITVPIMGTTGFPKRLAGPQEVSDTNTIDLWADRLGADFRAVVVVGATVHIVIAPNGDTAASYLECWKCEVTNVSSPKEFSATPAKVTITFDIQGANQYALIPA